MKKEFSTFPEPLQVQMLVRSGLGIAAMVIGLALLFITGKPIVAVPCVLITLLLAGNVLYIRHIVGLELYIKLTGTVVEVERSFARQRPKALILEVEGKALRLSLRSRIGTVDTGATVIIYAPESAPLYEWHGMHQLYSYLALVVQQQKSVARGH